MSNVASVLKVVLPILTALGLGVYSRHRGLIGASVIDGIKTLVMQFMLPAVLLGAFYKNVFSAPLVIIALSMFVTCLLGWGIGAIAGRFFTGGGQMLPFLTTGFEAGMMGYGLYAMLYPAAQAYNFALVDLGQVVFVFTVYMALLNRQKNISIQETLKGMLASKVFLAIAIGVLLSATKIGPAIAGSDAGNVIDAVLNYVSAPTGVLMLFVVGYQLEFDRLSVKSACITTLIRSAIMLVLGTICLYVLKLFIPMDASLFWAVVLMFTLPAPFVLPIFSHDEAQAGYVATSLSLGTLLSVALFIIISIVRA